MIDYSKLWTLLSEYGISKTEFMNQIGVSSATMAKLSNNQPVTMDILERICSSLRCSLDNVVSFLDGPDMQRQWCGINEGETYLVYLYFVQDINKESNMKFLYGYSCPFCLTREGLDVWTLSKYKNFDQIFQISGYSTGYHLLKLLKAFEENKPLGKILEENGIKTKCYGCKDEIRDNIFLLSLFQGTPKYRPAYILEARDRNSRTINAFCPQVAIGNYSMRCESLVECNLWELYYKNSKPDAGKIKELHAFLKTIYSAASVNDMARLGCFELLSYLNGNLNEESGIHWQIKKKEDRTNMRMVAEALEIILDHHIFSGSYAMLIRVCNTYNNFLEHLELINCNAKDYMYNIPLHESPGIVEIRLYKLSGNSFESNLVADSLATLIRNISFDVCIVDRRFPLDDSWTTIMKNKGKKIDTTTEYVSHEINSVNSQKNEVWYENERIVQKDCGQILNMNSKESEGIFFEAGDDMHMRFLNWLKQTLDKVACKRVIIIDPYIDVDAIGKILRGITNSSLTYDIYTANDVSRKTGEENKKRINEIKKALGQLRLVLPSSLNVYAVAGDDLHDRFLILEGEDSRETKVYSMSNSLDNVGQYHSSLVVQLDQRLALEVNRFYLALIEKKKEENKIEEVFSFSKSKTIVIANEKEEKKKLIHSVEEYKILCDKNLAEAFSQLAYLTPGELKSNCIEELANVDGFADKVKLLLDDYGASISNIDSNYDNAKRLAYEERRLVGIGQNLRRDIEVDLELMDFADYINGNYADYLHWHEPWYIQNAIRYFCSLQPKAAIAYLSTLRQELKEENPQKINLAKYKLAAMLIIRLVELLQYKKEEEKMKELMLASDIPFFHAIVIANSFSGLENLNEKCMENAVNKLNSLCQRLPFQEKLIAHIYVMKELQICYYRKEGRYQIVQPVIDEIIISLVSIIQNTSVQEPDYVGTSNDDLYRLFHALYSRNSEDICKIYALLVKSKYMEPKKAGEYLQKMLLEPFEKGLQNEKNVYYRANDLYESKRILSYIVEVNSSAIKELFKEIKKKERTVTGILYSATLKEQNYDLWKCYMDMLCCFVYLELWAEQNYQYKPSKAVEEFRTISSNYASTLTKYSEVYQIFVRDCEVE